MFTIIEGKLYKVEDKKMREVIIDNGTLKAKKETVEYKPTGELYSVDEIRIKYHLFPKKKENEQIVISDEQLGKEIEKLKLELKTVNGELENKENELETLKKEIEEKDSKIEELENAIVEKDSKIAELEKPNEQK